MNEHVLKGKVAVVTGAAHGIGRAIGEVFAEAGARVAVADIDDAAGEETTRVIRQKGGEALFCHADVSVEEHAKRCVAATLEQFGRLDILCNNASFLGEFHDVAGATREEWENCIAVGLLGAQYFTRQSLRWMVQNRNGSIVNIASVQGMVGGRNSVAYTTVKAGLLGFTRSVAYDYGKYNIRVNAICPGPVQTRISPKPGEELYQRQVAKTFLERVGQPKEVAYAALFLASDLASYITGAVLPVDGGWTAM